MCVSLLKMKNEAAIIRIVAIERDKEEKGEKLQTPNQFRPAT